MNEDEENNLKNTPKFIIEMKSGLRIWYQLFKHNIITINKLTKKSYIEKSASNITENILKWLRNIILKLFKYKK